MEKEYTVTVEIVKTDVLVENVLGHNTFIKALIGSLKKQGKIVKMVNTKTCPYILIILGYCP